MGPAREEDTYESTSTSSRLALLLALLLAVASAPVSAQSSDHFNEKFEFNGVTLGTDPVVTTDGTIYAGSKQVGPDQNRSQLTNCTYFDENSQSLGYYADDDFASTDPDLVRQFCIDNFDERNT